MEHFTNFFELHVGFSTELGESLVADFVTRIQNGEPDWSRSFVRSVHVTRPGCFDPHNVPGTLGWLVSRKIFQSAVGWKKTVEEAVLPASSRAVEELSILGATDARLEIEFPFGCFATSVVDGKIFRSAWTNDPVFIPADCLSFSFGKRMSDTPEWEIHFLLEKLPDSSQPEMGIEEVAGFLSHYGVDVEQTIEYQSAAMVESGRSDYRLIATAYFPDALATLKEGERLFYDSSLCQDALQRGYIVRLILEHIVTCLQPNSGVKDSGTIIKENTSEVNCAK